MPDSAPGGVFTALICRDLQIQHRDREVDHAPSPPDRETLVPQEFTVPGRYYPPVLQFPNSLFLVQLCPP